MGAHNRPRSLRIRRTCALIVAAAVCCCVPGCAVSDPTLSPMGTPPYPATSKALASDIQSAVPCPPFDGPNYSDSQLESARARAAAAQVALMKQNHVPDRVESPGEIFLKSRQGNELIRLAIDDVPAGGFADYTHNACKRLPDGDGVERDSIDVQFPALAVTSVLAICGYSKIAGVSINDFLSAGAVIDGYVLSKRGFDALCPKQAK